MKQNTPKERFLLVSVDSLFSVQEVNKPLLPASDVFTLAFYALEKAYRGGWTILFWTWRNKQHYASIINLLQEASLWDFCDPFTDEALLIRRPLVNESRIITKLTLLETRFGQVLDTKSADLIIIESDSDIALAVQSYVKDRAVVHMAPYAWLNMVAISPHRLDSYLKTTEKGKTYEFTI